MRVYRQPVVGMLSNTMVRLAGLIRRIDVDDDERQIIQMVEELVADLARDRGRGPPPAPPPSGLSVARRHPRRSGGSVRRVAPSYWRACPRRAAGTLAWLISVRSPAS